MKTGFDYPLVHDQGTRELARSVYSSSVEKGAGLLDVPDDECDIVLYYYTSSDDDHEHVRIAVDVIHLPTGSSDGWYQFLEQFLWDDASIPDMLGDWREEQGYVLEIDGYNGQWIFESLQAAIDISHRWIRENVGLQRKFTAICRG